ncbi:MAG: hypothetical protein COW32_06440 [Candidatus Aquicultor secundus]|uniref:PAS domain S-box protein n=1 Tax=Candidatus Aquicultor secundus TaxID=1973895 RepID=A0A2M7T7B9_9ACTN|nr:PAS domain S-box protein [Candidatus Aquicultor secundus]NCO66524.1 PAS domain S-box protein [Solirubrobacter sp.]OIO87065.1 MAG: hypothetical protein AUK32_04500 [Candidatus Aquicultor secundus]PIU27555.1 MAG: hypothetical protein COT10_02850 [Candidatus Aquicultor secundus]PIW22090.1 MAG: hypothetical protein COW32_06440 [Candidatus Aquicultor secundus]PIX51287.1 MAG: hypothetical protein COZ51_10465 [Candidatus Aquicultor secundus]
MKKVFSREKLEQMVETIPDGIIVVDRHGRIVFVNTTTERILGFKRNRGKPVQAEDRLLSQIMEIDMLAHGGEHAYERPDGTRVIISVNASPFHSTTGVVEGTVLSLRDITELKKAEQELKFKSLLLDSAIDSIIVHDPQGKIIYVNEAAYKTRGYTREEIMAMPLRKLVVPDDARLINPG